MTADQILDDAARAVMMTLLAGVPGLLRDLDITLTRQARFTLGAPVGRGSAHTRLPLHLAASAAIDGLEVVLRVFTGKLAAGRPAPHEPIEQARWLRAALPGIPGDAPALEGFEHALTVAVAEGFAAIDRPLERVYLGLCECGLPLYAVVDDIRAQCECGAEVSVAARREWMLRQARFRVGTAGQLARLLPWFAGVPITEAALSKAGTGGKLPSIKVGERRLYRIGDVLDWHAARHTAQACDG